MVAEKVEASTEKARARSLKKQNFEEKNSNHLILKELDKTEICFTVFPHVCILPADRLQKHSMELHKSFFLTYIRGLVITREITFCLSFQSNLFRALEFAAVPQRYSKTLLLHPLETSGFN